MHMHFHRRHLAHSTEPSTAEVYSLPAAHTCNTLLCAAQVYLKHDLTSLDFHKCLQKACRKPAEPVPGRTASAGRRGNEGTGGRRCRMKRMIRRTEQPRTASVPSDVIPASRPHHAINRYNGELGSLPEVLRSTQARKPLVFLGKNCRVWTTNHICNALQMIVSTRHAGLTT